MVKTTVYDVVFVGGPRDGVKLQFADLPQKVLFPEPLRVSLATTWALADNVATFRMSEPVAVYELAYAYGRPSLDDAGRYRYQYGGTRT